MPKRAEREFRRAGKKAPEPQPPAGMPWYTKLGLILLTVLLLSLSFAPFGQFYLAWVGLVPWLLMVRETKSQRGAFLWSWLAGVLFFIANMWWLAMVTAPGMVALMVLLGLYWAVAAVVIRGAGLLSERWLDRAVPAWLDARLATVLLVPAAWVSLEWLRGNWPLNGLPWLFLGHGQTPILAMCQVADALGVYGISFWVVAINALVALFVIDRFNFTRLVPAAATVGPLLALVLGYGVWRLSQTDQREPGPMVMVVQSNYPQSNTGEKGATQAELVDFHLSRTDMVLRLSNTPDVDLVVWSETMMPHVNRSAREALRETPAGDFLEDVYARIADLTRRHRVSLLTGAIYADKWTLRDGEPFASDRRNTAFFFEPGGNLREEDGGRYDKVHIVPFGEYLPWKSTFPFAYRLFLALSPYPAEYFLTPGDESAIRPFHMPQREQEPGRPTQYWSFVTPICFEDIDPLLVARMFRWMNNKPGKRADFIVNITNDGWFTFNQMPQHLQAARFRSIENRAPTARSVNTGISGFVDSFGRVDGLVPAGTEGTSVQRLQLDRRLTLYTRFGDLFAAACAFVTIVLASASVVGWALRRRRLGADAAGGGAKQP